MPNYEVAFVDNNGNPIVDGILVTAYTNDGTNTILDTGVTGVTPATVGQGAVYFTHLQSNITYKFGFSTGIVGFRLLQLPIAPTIVVPTGVTGATGPQGIQGVQGQGLTWRASWNSGATYNAYDVVSYQGTVYIATATTLNSVPTSLAGWNLAASAGASGLSFDWRGAFNILTSYNLNDVVSYANSSYISIATPNLGNQPLSASTFWALMAAAASSAGLNYRGTWVSTNNYAVDDAVSYLGSSYICSNSNINVTPPNLSFWNVLSQAGSNGANGATGANGFGQGFNFTGPWSSLTTYQPYDLAQLGGSTYFCDVTNTNSAPPNSNWILFASEGVGLNWTGAWSSATTYKLDDAVSLSGSSYVCVTGNTNQAPPNSNWNILAGQSSNTLAALTDVALISSVSPDSLVYNGTHWTNVRVGRKSLRLKMCSADFTPNITGIDIGGLGIIPYDPQSGGSITWNLVALVFRVETTAVTGTTSVKIQRSTGTGPFVNAGYLNTASFNITAGQYEAAGTGTFAVPQVVSGDKLMPEYTALGAGALGYTLYLVMEEV